MKPEEKVKAKIRAYLKEIGAWQYWPVPYGMGMATVDVLFCHRGRFYACEAKRPGIKEATGRQSCVLRDIAKAGGGICVENSEGLETLRALLAGS